MARFVRFAGTKNLIDVDNIAFILNPELNTYVIIPKQSIAPSVPKLNGFEYDALVKYLGTEDVAVEKPDESAEKPLIARVDDDKKITRAA